MLEKTYNRRLMGLTVVGAAVGGATLLLSDTPASGEVVAGPAAQATAVSPQSPQPTPTTAGGPPPPRPVRFFPVDSRFQDYYNRVDGPRTMGSAISRPTTTVDGRPAQYFEKARLEDRTGESPNPEWQFAYGLLVDEMKAVRSQAPVGGDRSNVTYSTIQDESAESRRIAPPAGFGGNVLLRGDGSAFIPFSADLSVAAGHNVPRVFWDYINDPTLFPGGWLHDIGLPITEPIEARVDKGIIIGTTVTPVTNRPITIQAFQRTILTYDAANPAGFLVERANTGTDFYTIFPDRVPQ
jgi:hypothetical protein